MKARDWREGSNGRAFSGFAPKRTAVAILILASLAAFVGNFVENLVESSGQRLGNPTKFTTKFPTKFVVCFKMRITGTVVVGLDTPVSLGLCSPPMSIVNHSFTIAGRCLRSRLILGTGKFSSPERMRDAIEASGCEMVTVALRRADLSGGRDPFANILEFIDPQRFLVLPNTSGAMNAEEAVRLARLARAAGLPAWVKLEIHPDPRYLLPDPVETFKAAEILVKEGFVVLPYINADPVLARRLQDIGTAAVMPLGSPIGSNRGLKTRDQIQIIIEQATVPVVVDAGLGAPSHAAEAMEMGADAVLVNTAIAVASDPVRMARAFQMATEAGRLAFATGLASEQFEASATSPLTAFLDRPTVVIAPD